MARNADRIRAVKGTRDILPPESRLWLKVEEICRDILDAYGFQEIRTPIFEETELFARSVGTNTDIVSKEMYSFEDRDGRSLTLRPEATASVMRAYLDSGAVNQGGSKSTTIPAPCFAARDPKRAAFGSFTRSARRCSARTIRRWTLKFLKC